MSRVPARPVTRAFARKRVAAKRKRGDDSVEYCVLARVLRSPPVAARAYSEGTVSGAMREIVVDWMMEVCGEYGVRDVTCGLAIGYFDAFLGVEDVKVGVLQLAAIVCVLIACKVEEAVPPSVADVVFICDGGYKPEDVRAFERCVLNALGFRLTGPTPFAVVEHLARSVDGDAERIVRVARFAVYVALLDSTLVRAPPGVVAIAAVIVAAAVEGIDGTPQLPRPVSELVAKGNHLALVEKTVAAIFRSWARIGADHEERSRWLFIHDLETAALYPKKKANLLPLSKRPRPLPGADVTSFVPIANVVKAPPVSKPSKQPCRARKRARQ